MHPYHYIGLPGKIQKRAYTNQFKENIYQIIDEVCQKLSIDPDRLKVRCRKRELTDARKILFKILHDKQVGKVKEIGSIFNLDHGSVIYLRDSANDLIETNAEFRQKYQICIN